MSHVREKNVAFDNLGNGGTSLLQDCLKVLAALFRFIGDGALDHGALGGERNLTRAVDGGGSLDSLGLTCGENRTC